MKHLVLYISILFLSNTLFAQKSHRYNHKEDYAKLSIGPEIGGMAFMSMSESNKWSSYFGYTIGGLIDTRPFRSIGLTTGLAYDKIINGTHFYEIPIILNYYAKNDLVISGGPIIFSDPQNGKLNFQNPTIGAILGFKKDKFGLCLFYHPDYVVNNEETRIFIGLIIRIQLFIKII
jgi:hypothetical protein